MSTEIVSQNGRRITEVRRASICLPNEDFSFLWEKVNNFMDALDKEMSSFMKDNHAVRWDITETGYVKGMSFDGHMIFAEVECICRDTFEVVKKCPYVFIFGVREKNMTVRDMQGLDSSVANLAKFAGQIADILRFGMVPPS